MKYDIVIIGGGPAGLSAAIHSERFHLKCALIEKEKLGGQANAAWLVRNFPSDESCGRALMNTFIKKAKKTSVKFYHDEVLKVFTKKSFFDIKTKNNGKINCRAVIFAAGLIPKRIPMLKKAFYYPDPCELKCKNKKVMIIGGGDSAFDQALYFSKLGAKVTIFIRSKRVKCIEWLHKKAMHDKNVKIIFNKKMFLKTLAMYDITIVDIGKKRSFSILAKKRTKGLFLAGDFAHPKIRHIAVAAGDGVRAMEEAVNFLREKDENN